jgi:3-oxoacyl-[acyl-carrier-protein] synthase-3
MFHKELLLVWKESKTAKIYSKYLNMPYSKIIGTGSYLPQRVMLNAELEAIVDTSDEWIQSRTGIKQRHIAREDESTCDMAVQAAIKAFSTANVDKNDIDLIIFATSTPDQTFPSTACLLQRKLEINNGCAAFDVQAVCAGFVYAISIADNFIKSGSASCVLVVGADSLSKIVDWTDRSTCVLFGDGAGAIVIKASAEPGIYQSKLHANGEYAKFLEVPSGVSKPGNEPFIKMSGSDVFKFAVNVMDNIVDEVLQGTDFSKDDIDWLVPHQANKRIISATAKKLGLSMEKVVVTVDEHGNTSAASIPLALDTAVLDGRIKPGHLLLMEAIGGGFAWGATLIRF